MNGCENMLTIEMKCEHSKIEEINAQTNQQTDKANPSHRFLIR